MSGSLQVAMHHSYHLVFAKAYNAPAYNSTIPQGIFRQPVSIYQCF